MRRAGDLRGRVALVTGPARGIGSATARALVARGAHVSLVGLEPHRLASLAESIGPGAVWFEADVTDQQALDAAVAGTASRFGRIDAVVANAGITNYGTVRTAEPDEFARTVDVNLIGAYRTVAAALPHLLVARGYVLLISSVASFVSLPGAAAYSASKAGVESLAGALRLELAPTGVDVGSAFPSWIDTDLVRDAERSLPVAGKLRAALPWPVGGTTPVEVCADRLVDAVARRARRVHVPRAVALVGATRPLLQSRPAERVMRGRAREMIPELERQVRALGERIPREERVG